MFSWITGPRITNVIENLPTDSGNETTFLEPPETPAHQFAVKAFKTALFGAPAPQDAPAGTKKLEKKAKLEQANAKVDFPPPKENAPPVSPSKQPNGILMTPGTANKGRKTVSFGAQVVDNEGKRQNGKSGIPTDCPGRFPSPWTPGTELIHDPGSDNKPRTKLTAALYDARTTTQPKQGQKPKARDDSDITLDLGAPRAESGKYWKEQYETYAENSEKEMKKLVNKQQLAKSYAKKKDAEAIEATTRLAEERKRFRNRERELEQQNKDYQERLRKAMAENASASMEITALKSRIAALEKSFVLPSSELQDSKMAFKIHEDSSCASTFLGSRKNPEPRHRPTIDPPPVTLEKPAKSSQVPPENKENSPPKARHPRRSTLPDASPRQASSHPVAELAPEFSEAATILAMSPYTSTRSQNPSRPSDNAPISTATARPSELAPKSPANTRTTQPNKENLPPKSPAIPVSSPLPVPSPDPWMPESSPFPEMNRMAFPISNAPTYTKPSRPTIRHRVAKSTSNGPKADAFKATSKAAEKNDAANGQADETKPSAGGNDKMAAKEQRHRGIKTGRDIMNIPIRDLMGQDKEPRSDKVEKFHSAAANAYLELEKKSQEEKEEEKTRHHAPPSSAQTGHANTSAIGNTTAHGNSKTALPADRRAEAKKRLEARKLRQQQQH